MKSDFGVDVEIIIRKHHLRHSFPGEVLEKAQAISPVLPHKELEHRNDYRDLPIVTIDGETARDFDDAVHVRRLAGGSYELQVQSPTWPITWNTVPALMRRHSSAGHQFIFLIAPCPCSRWNSPLISAACVRKLTAWCCPA